MGNELSLEEQEILEAFEKGELTAVDDAQHQRELARRAAHNTLRIIQAGEPEPTDGFSSV